MQWVNKVENVPDWSTERIVALNRLPPAGDDILRARSNGRPAPEGELQFLQLVAILRRRARLILAIAAAGTVLATIVGLLIPPRYTATAQLLVDVQAGASGPASAAVTTDEIVDTHVTLLGSSDHFQRVIDSLLQNPKFRAPEHQAGGVNDAAAASSNTASSPASAEPAAESSLFSELKHRLNIWIGAPRKRENVVVPSFDELEHNTRINQERRSRVISVAFTAVNPDKAAAISNRVVQLYVGNLVEKKRAQADGDIERLDKQIAESKIAMKIANLAVQSAIQKQLSAPRNDAGLGKEADERLRELKRNAQANAQIFGSLLRRQRERGDIHETISPGISVHSLASVPDRPSSHNPLLFIFPAFVLFAIGGSWLAVVLDKLDHGLHSERETSNALGISCIGLVPMRPGHRMAWPWSRVVTEPCSAYGEAIRSVVATLQLGGVAHDNKVVLISSSLPGEGKSTLARSLAEYYSSVGQNVLLVDVASRSASRPRDLGGNDQQQTAGSRQPEPQLTKLIFRPTDAAFDYLPVLGGRIDPLLLYARGQFSHLLAELRETYDIIVLDGPAVFDSAESRLLPSLADKVLFAVAWGSTRREVAQNACDLLRWTGSVDNERVKAPIAVLTRVNLNEHARYRFGDTGDLQAKYKKYYTRQLKRSWRREQLVPSLAVFNDHSSKLEEAKDATYNSPA